VRAKVKLHLKIMRWPLVLLFYAAVLLCVRVPVHGEFIPLGLTRGEVRGEIDYIVFSRWLLMMAAPILVNGWYLERVSGIEIFVRLRMKSLSRYRLFLLCGCMANSAVWALFIAVVVLVFLGLIFVAVTSPPPLNFRKGVQTNGNHHNK